jgi:hypothetical protein
MKNALNLLLNDSQGNPVYDAAYNAFYEANKGDENAVSAADDPNGIAGGAVGKVNERMKTLAETFAKEFCNKLKDGKFMDSIADEIDKHIKSMELFISVLPTGIATVVSPVGPCTGAMIISKATADIQIQ